MSKSKFSTLSLIFVTILLSVLCLFAGCKQKNYIYEINLGEGFPTVQLKGDYYSVAVSETLKADDAIADYRVDSDSPRIIVYRFDWRTEDGNWNNYLDYLNYEASKYGATLHKANWVEAGYPDGYSYCKLENVEGKIFITTCYALINGNECVEVVYLDKSEEVLINDANVKFMVPKVTKKAEATRNLEGLVEFRSSDNDFFPSLLFYCTKKTNANETVYSDSFAQKIKTKENATSLEKSTIGVYKVLNGSKVDEVLGKVDFTVYEVGDYFVTFYYTVNYEEMAAHGRDVGKSITPIS